LTHDLHLGDDGGRHPGNMEPAACY
jgi:hypothetical protein